MRFDFSGHSLDVGRRELWRGPDRIEIEPQVFDLLVYLIENRDRVVSKDGIIASVWGGRIVSESTLTSRIAAVRKSVGDSGEQQALIRTEPRRGRSPTRRGRPFRSTVPWCPYGQRSPANSEEDPTSSLLRPHIAYRLGSLPSPDHRLAAKARLRWSRALRRRGRIHCRHHPRTIRIPNANRSQLLRRQSRDLTQSGPSVRRSPIAALIGLLGATIWVLDG